MITWHLAMVRLGEHLELTARSVLLAALVMLPLGLFLGHVRRGSAAVTVLTDVSRAVPTYGVLIIFSGLATLSSGDHDIVWTVASFGTLSGDDRGIVLALAIFAAAPLLTNTVTGLHGVDRDVIDAARGLGMSSGQILRRVELPLALPLIAAGIRTAVVQVVATATLATYVGAGGLGAFIENGYGVRDTGEIVGGALLVAGLAVVADVALGAVQAWVTPGPRRQLHRSGRVWIRAGRPA